MKIKLILTVAALCLAGVSHAGGAGPEPLTLRVNDATAVPGGLAAVVVRTYASRPIRQGQICFRMPSRLAAERGRKGGATGDFPFVSLENAIVFSAAGDAVEQSDMFVEGEDQVTLLNFSSESATVNAADGPMLALFYRVRADVLPEDHFIIDLDLANTTLYDDQGQPILIEDRDGELRIRSPATPISLAIASEKPENGRVLLSLQTDEVLNISSGQFAFNYSQLFTGTPKVYIDPRYGNASLNAFWLRGQILVQFDSSDNTLGQVPGDIVGAVLNVHDTADPTIDRRLWLDPTLTYLYDGTGATLTLDLEGDVIP